MAWFWICTAVCSGQSPLPAAAGLEFRLQTDDIHLQALTDLAADYEQKGRADLAQQSREWFIPRDLGHQYLFLISAQDALPLRDDASPQEREWHQEMAALRAAQADRLWELADRALVDGEAERAVQLIHEVLRERPDDKRAWRALGYGKRPRLAQSSITPRLARNAQHAFGWPAGEYWRLQTDHFLITTNHSAQAAEDLAQVLEEFYSVWQQLFISFRSTPASVRQAVAGRGLSRRAANRHRVVLFRDQAEYVNHLTRAEPQANMTLGVYRDSDRTAYFFVGDKDRKATWRHEVAHQLFYESTRRGHAVGLDQNFWLVEGVALYLESLQRHEGYYTVGGFDGERLQFARYRALQEGFYVPLKQLSGMGRIAVQQDPRIRRLYSQAAGLVHFLMDDQGGTYRRATLDVLRKIYQGQDEVDSLAEATGKSLSDLDSEYLQAIMVSDEQVASLPRGLQPRKLCLGRSAKAAQAENSVTDRGLEALAQQRHLDWLDLAYCPVTDVGVRALSTDLPLVQLNLEGTQITDAALAHISRWSTLRELDLSHTEITDAGLAELAKLRELRVLWLTGTKITDQGLRQLAGLKHLQTLDVDRTQVSPGAWQDFKTKRPQLNASAGS